MSSQKLKFSLLERVSQDWWRQHSKYLATGKFMFFHSATHHSFSEQQSVDPSCHSWNAAPTNRCNEDSLPAASSMEAMTQSKAVWSPSNKATHTRAHELANSSQYLNSTVPSIWDSPREYASLATHTSCIPVYTHRRDGFLTGITEVMARSGVGLNLHTILLISHKLF